MPIKDVAAVVRRIRCRLREKPFEIDLLRPRGFQTPDYSRHQHLLIGKDLDANRINAWQGFLLSR